MQGWVDLWCKVAPAEIQTCNFPISNLALYHTATSVQDILKSHIIFNLVHSPTLMAQMKPSVRWELTGVLEPHQMPLMTDSYGSQQELRNWRRITHVKVHHLNLWAQCEIIRIEISDKSHYSVHTMTTSNITSRVAIALFVCPLETYSMPVACSLSNVTQVTSAPVKTFSLLPACFMAGRKYIAAVLFNNVNIPSNYSS